MRCSVIEIGSNTVKCTVYDIRGKGDTKTFDTVLCQNQTVGLINYTSGGVLSGSGIKRLCGTVGSLVKLSKGVYCKKVHIIATAGLRSISNCGEVVKKLKRACGYKIRVISGKEEAMYGFSALSNLFSNRLEDGIAIDLGGGSTEIVLIRDGKAEKIKSVGLGALRLYNEYVSGILPSPSEIDEMKKAFDAALKGIDWLCRSAKKAYLIGGSGRALFSVNSDICGTGTKNDAGLDTAQLDELLKIYRNPSKEDVKRLIRLLPDRIHMIVPGMVAYNCIFKAAGAELAVASFSKVRDGFIIEKYIKQGSNPQKQPDQSCKKPAKKQEKQEQTERPGKLRKQETTYD